MLPRPFYSEHAMLYRPPCNLQFLVNKIFVISRLIMRFTKILCRENLELYGTLNFELLYWLYYIYTIVLLYKMGMCNPLYTYTYTMGTYVCKQCIMVTPVHMHLIQVHNGSTGLYYSDDNSQVFQLWLGTSTFFKCTYCLLFGFTCSCVLPIQ